MGVCLSDKGLFFWCSTLGSCAAVQMCRYWPFTGNRFQMNFRWDLLRLLWPLADESRVRLCFPRVASASGLRLSKSTILWYSSGPRDKWFRREGHEVQRRIHLLLWAVTASLWGLQPLYVGLIDTTGRLLAAPNLCFNDLIVWKYQSDYIVVHGCIRMSY